MSVAILKQTYDEVRRVSIAGSVVAANDFRLKKLVAPLEQLGQKAPVFGKIAQAVTKLAESSEKESAEALLELSTLVIAVLYTQGETGAAGELTPIETTYLGQQQTPASARVLKPLIEALSTTGSGRMEVIQDAHQRDFFRDLRLVGPALAALDDPYAEISAFMAEKVLPMYGLAIFTELRSTLDLKGRGGHVHRLALMYKLDPTATRETVTQALEEGSKEMRVAAIECLGSAPDDLAILLENAEAKAKDVRAAALRALARCDGAEAIAALRAAFESGNIEMAVRSVADGRGPQLTALVLEEANTQWDVLLSGKEKDKAKLAKQVERVLRAIECLRGRDDRATEAFLVRAFGERVKLAAIKGDPGGKDVELRLVSIMAAGPAKAQQALIDAHADLPEDEIAEAFTAARKLQTPAEVFDKFGPYFTGKFHITKKGRDAASTKREAIATAIIHCRHVTPYDLLPGADIKPATDPNHDLDPRWLDLAVKAEHLLLVQALAVPGNSGANKLLTKAFDECLGKSRSAYDVVGLLRTMVRIEHPQAADAIVETIMKYAKSVHGYALSMIAPLIAELPKDSLPKLEAILPSLPEKVLDHVLDFVNLLKSRP
jgi:hypothetical protein